MAGFSWVRKIVPLSSNNKGQLATVAPHLSDADVREIRTMLKQKHVGFVSGSLGLSPWLLSDIHFPLLTPLEEEVADDVAKWNAKIRQAFLQKQMAVFAPVAEEKLPLAIAPHIEGLDIIKHAAALQLVSAERFHILLLGDPGTGKTDIIRAVSELHSNSRYGLGSGASGVGLTIAVQGATITPGLLPQANNGICALDELNLIKDKDLGSLYNAMEKGFVAYHKANQNITYEAQVRIIATANPRGDRFVGKGLQILKDQIPFDTALLTRFHLIFFIRSPNIEKFVAISKKIVDGQKLVLSDADKEFLQDYVDYAETIEVDFPASLKEQIVDFAEELKANEKEYLVDISPRTVHGILRMAIANARLSMRRKVEQHDIDIAKRIMKTSLEIVK